MAGAGDPQRGATSCSKHWVLGVPVFLEAAADQLSRVLAVTGHTTGYDKL